MLEPSPVVPNPRVVHSRLADGEVVLLHLETGQYHELNAIGSMIWDLLDGRRGAGEVAVEIRTRVEDPPDDLNEVVSEFLAQLRQRGLIT